MVKQRGVVKHGICGEWKERNSSRSVVLNVNYSPGPPQIMLNLTSCPFALSQLNVWIYPAGDPNLRSSSCHSVLLSCQSPKLFQGRQATTYLSRMMARPSSMDDLPPTWRPRWQQQTFATKYLSILVNLVASQVVRYPRASYRSSLMMDISWLHWTPALS